MLKRQISYKTFDDPPQEITETFYFNLSETDIFQMEMYKEAGMDNFLRRIVQTEDRRQLWDEFKNIVLTSYGERSSDMKSFLKTPEIRARFEASNAFTSLFMELMQNQDKLEEFIMGVMPESVIAEARKSQEFNDAVKAAAAQRSGVTTSSPPIDIPTNPTNAPVAEVPAAEFKLPEQPA